MQIFRIVSKGQGEYNRNSRIKFREEFKINARTDFQTVHRIDIGRNFTAT